MKKYFIIVLGAFLSSFFYAYSQLNNFITYSIHDGLPQSRIYAIIQDKRGYLWLGTDGGGLCYFDGKEFNNYTRQDGLSGNIVRSIMQDSKGNLWIGTDNGITVYDGFEFYRLEEKLGLSDKQVMKFLEDSKGTIWACTAMGGLYKMNWMGKDSVLFDAFTTEQGLITDLVFDIHEDQYNRLWLAMYGGINVIIPEKDTILIHTIESGWQLPARFITCIEEDSNGDIWFGSNDLGVFQFKDITQESYGEIVSFNTKNGMNDNQVWDIYSLDEDQIWMATYNGGINIYSNGTFRYYTQEHGLPSNEIHTILQDDERNIWLGTLNDGLCKFLGNHFSHYGVYEGLSDPNVSAIDYSTDGTLWIGTTGGGLMKAEWKNGERRFNYFTTELGLIENNITSLCVDQDNTVWFAYSQNGVGKFDGQRFYHYTKENGLINDNVYCVYVDSKGDLWCGTSGGISNFNEDGFLNSISAGLSDSKEVQTIIEDSRGNMWFGTLNGLSRYDWENMYNYDEAEGLEDKRIQALAEDHNGNIWIGTFGGGLYKFDYGVDDSLLFRQIATDENISSNIINSLLFQNDSTLIVGTDKGFDVLVLNPEGEIRNVRNYDETNGFFGIENNINAICRGARNNIWFGTVSGLTKYAPDLEFINNEPPRIQLTGLKLWFEDIDWSNRAENIMPWNKIPEYLKLSHTDNNLTFNFTGISLTNPLKVRYRYMLKGLTTEWSPPITDNEVIYQGLNPGDYTFQVIAESGNGIWNEEPLAYSFTIKPPFWQTWWFITIVIIFVGLLIIAYIKYRERQLILKNRELEQKVQERTAEIRKQKEVIEAKNRDITDSIRYAKNIQDALLPSEKVLGDNVRDYFILYKPRDIVSGDFYWVKNVDMNLVVVAADCTGHGVPGAFMSLLGMSYLDDIVEKERVTNPGRILNRLREEVITALKQKGIESESKDGMDVALCTIDLTKNKLQYSGANNPLYFLKDHELAEIKGDRMPVAIHTKMTDFTTHPLTIDKGQTFYIFSDGYADQFGGPKGKKFKYTQFKELLLEIQDKGMLDQKEILDQRFEEWRGDLYQVDDVVVIGVRY